MSGLFEHIEMFDEGDKVATRQAVAVANKRFNDTFASFLRQASSEKEFNGRLALVEQDIANMAADVANEYGGDAEKIAKAVSATVKAAFGPTPPAHEAPMCENCGGHGCEQCDDDSDDYPEDDGPFIDKYEMPHIGDDWDYTSSKKTSNDPIWDEATTKFVRMHPEEVAPGTPAEQIPSEAYETAKYHIDQDKDTILANVTSYDVDSVMKAIERWFNQHFRTASKDRPEHLKAQDEVQLADEHSQVAPWLKKQIQDEDQEDGGNLRNKEAAAHTVEKKGDKFFVIEDGDEKAAGPFDSKEKAQARAKELNNLENLETEKTHKEAKGKCECWDGYKRVPGTKPCAPGSCEKCDDHSKKKSSITPAMARALQLKQAAKPETGDSHEDRVKLPTGNEDAHDGPSPKMDKKKWKPNATNPDGNLKPIKTEGENSPVPTRHMDIKDKPDYQEDTFDTVKKYDNNNWERQTLPNKRDHDSAGFEATRNIQEETKAAETFPNKNQANPVTKVSLPDALAEKQSAMWDPGRPGRMILDALANEYPDIANALDQAEGGDMKAIRQLVRSGLLQQAQELAFSLHEFDPNNYPQPDIPAEIERGVAQGDPEAAQEYIRMFREDGGDELDAEATEPEIAPEEDMEEIIERGDDEGDRVEVVHEHDEEESDEPDSFDELDGPTDEQLERFERGEEEDPDEWK